VAARNTGDGVYVQGLSDMRRVLKAAEHELAPELTKRLYKAGEGIVAPVARRYAPVGVRSAQYRFGGKDLRDTIRVSAAGLRGASVYSTSVYGGAQNYGGRVGRGGATVLRRSDVSQFMTRAVKDTRLPVAAEVESTLDWLAKRLDS